MIALEESWWLFRTPRTFGEFFYFLNINNLGRGYRMSKKCPDENCGGEMIKISKSGIWLADDNPELVCTNKEYHLKKRIEEIYKLEKKPASPP